MVARMRSFLEKDLKRTVRLDIFGSLVNGLGAGGSDVDICFRFDSDEQPLVIPFFTHQMRGMEDLM
ncbi:toxin-antitoxin system, toxin component domain protein [Ancylostoma duodenale]|uniref:Toxin-antitoxin system, toxin component domain protein n=1 Tax=Ancylostoma duodenale TaxID=51022 RepID=A0A0C2GZS2_9BILA|nr:toxin-antitoxin system, toxin component domain protein [Ancylostoma duodenale]